MDVRIDPEAAQVRVVEDREAARWQVVLVLEECDQEHHTEGDARRRALGWRERLGVVGPEWVRRERAAERLGVGVKMVDKLRRLGRLRGRRVAATNRAYVHREDLERLEAERGTP